MSYVISTTEDQVYDALQAFIMDALGLAQVQVIKELLNRVSTPDGNWVSMNCISRPPSSRPVITGGKTADVFDHDIIQHNLEYKIQLDTYGDAAADMATILNTIWNSAESVQFMGTNNLPIMPLYAEEPRQVPIYNSEDQWEDRWVTVVHLQYNILLTAPQAVADNQALTLIDASRAYAP